MTWINFVHTRLFLNEESEQAANAIMDTAEGPKMKHWPGHIWKKKNDDGIWKNWPEKLTDCTFNGYIFKTCYVIAGMYVLRKHS